MAVCLQALGSKGGGSDAARGRMTGGLVGAGGGHVWLPSVTPLATVLLSLLAMLPGCPKPSAPHYPCTQHEPPGLPEPFCSQESLSTLTA